MDSIIDQSYAAHHEALDAAYHEHERVREEAILYLQRLHLEEEIAKEQHRLKLERKNRRLAEQAIELAQQSIPIPKVPSRPSTPPPALEPMPVKEATPKVPSPVQQPVLPKKAPSPIQGTFAPLQETPRQLPRVSQPTPEVKTDPPIQPPPIQQFQQHQPIQQQTKPPSPSVSKPVPTLQASTINTAESDDSHLLPGADRYLEIHKSLKKLRAWVMETSKTSLPKGKVGDLRRAIRTAVGQLTDVKGANKDPLNKIMNALKEAMVLPSPFVDPANFMLSPPSPAGPDNNLPSLLIYLLSIFSKVVVTQFIEEAGANPKAAEPIGVIAITVFAKPEFQYRGCSLIDIFMAKMRVVCPVVFGVRGSDKTERGRANQGWHKEAGEWVSDQVHNTRMTGLGAGYAAIALRDFGKTSMVNPWPPSYYWRSLASIVMTPDPSGTQYLVTKAMIEHYEQRFLTFYGSAGRAALQVALVEFPNRDKATPRTVAGSSLRTLADKLRKDVGLILKGAA